jgi:hypothetical protein
MGAYIEGFNLEPRFLTWTISRHKKSLSPEREPKRFSSSFRCGRHKFKFRTADRRIFLSIWRARNQYLHYYRK